MKKKIAIIIAGFPVVSETFILNHIVQMIKKGYDVKIFADKYYSSEIIHKDIQRFNLLDKTNFRINPGKSLFRIIKIIFFFLLNIKYSSTLIKSFSKRYYGNYARKGYFFFEVLPYLKKKHRSFDIVHAHFGNIGNKVAMLRSLGLLKGKFICTFHGHDINDYRQIQQQNKYRELLRECNALIFGTEFILKQFESKIGTTIPKYINPVSVDFSKIKKKTKYMISEKIILITVGRLVFLKGHHVVIKAIAEIKNKFPDLLNKFEYKIIGNGEEQENLIDLCKEFSLENHIRFLGPLSQEEVFNHLEKADVFILPGVVDKYGGIDAQGLVVQEAQAAGLPVIVSDAGGLSEGIIPGKTGFIVNENSIEELTDKILFFINYKEKIEEMGKKASLFITQNYSNEIVFNKLLEIYENI